MAVQLSRRPQSEEDDGELSRRQICEAATYCYNHHYRQLFSPFDFIYNSFIFTL